MGQDIVIIAAVVTIVGGGGLIGILIGILRNKELIKSTLADWTRRGVKVIYFVISYSKQGNVTLFFYLCGEETSWLYPGTYRNNESYILAMKRIRYEISGRSYSNRDWSDWTAMFVEPLSKDEFPCVVQLVSENRFRFWIPNELGQVRNVSDSYQFKTELKECIKKCEIKYVKKVPIPQDRWKSKDK